MTTTQYICICFHHIFFFGGGVESIYVNTVVMLQMVILQTLRSIQ